MKGLAPTGPMFSIFKQALPYCAVMAIEIALIMVFPNLALWLPGLMIG